MTAATRRLSPAMLRVGQVPLRLLRWGMPLGPLQLLQTTGRNSGLPRLVPVAVLRHGGERWLVSPFGETQWVRNIRANGVARLGAGRRLRPVMLHEVVDQRRPLVLRHYRRAFGIVPFVRAAFDADMSDTVGTAREADRHPVFRIGLP